MTQGSDGLQTVPDRSGTFGTVAPDLGQLAIGPAYVAPSTLAPQLRNILKAINSLNDLRAICDRKNENGYQIGPDWARATSTIAFEAVQRWREILQDRLEKNASSMPSVRVDPVGDRTQNRERDIREELRWIDAQVGDVQGLDGFLSLIVNLATRLFEVGREDPEAQAVALGIQNSLTKFRAKAIAQVRLELDYPQETPLSLVSRNRTVLEFLKELDGFRQQVGPELQLGKQYSLSVSLNTLERVRQEYTAEVLGYQGALRGLCDLLCNRYMETTALWSHVMAVAENERKVKSRPITRQELMSHTDGQLREILMREFEQEYDQPTLSANFIEYRAQAPKKNVGGVTRRYGVCSLFARIKASSLTDKIALAMFGADKEFNADKQITCLTSSLKDVYGLKFVVATKSQLNALLDEFRSDSGIKFSPGELEAVGMNPELANATLKEIEFKDYRTPRKGGRAPTRAHSNYEKSSGFEAAKLVVIWQGRTVEIQFMTEKAYNQERQGKNESPQSHESYRERKERLCQQVADRHSLFAFTRALLRLTFLGNTAGEIENLSPPPGIGLTLN